MKRRTSESSRQVIQNPILLTSGFVVTIFKSLLHRRVCVAVYLSDHCLILLLLRLKMTYCFGLMAKCMFFFFLVLDLQDFVLGSSMFSYVVVIFNLL
jgi:hypothetical protein